MMGRLHSSDSASNLYAASAENAVDLSTILCELNTSYDKTLDLRGNQNDQLVDLLRDIRHSSSLPTIDSDLLSFEDILKEMNKPKKRPDSDLLSFEDVLKEINQVEIVPSSPKNESKNDVDKSKKKEKKKTGFLKGFFAGVKKNLAPSPLGNDSSQKKNDAKKTKEQKQNTVTQLKEEENEDEDDGNEMDLMSALSMLDPEKKSRTIVTNNSEPQACQKEENEVVRAVEKSRRSENLTQRSPRFVDSSPRSTEENSPDQSRLKKPNSPAQQHLVRSKSLALSQSSINIANVLNDTPRGRPQRIVVNGEVFSLDSARENYIFKGGTIAKLVERLTDPDKLDSNYTVSFMLTFRNFSSPHELVDLLISRFQITSNIVPTDDGEDLTSRQVNAIHLRVLNIIKKWVKESDDFDDPQLQAKLRTFLQNTVATTEQKGLVAILKSCCTLLENRNNGRKPPRWVVVDPACTVPLTAFSITKLAQQLTLMEHEFFSAIRPQEYFKQAWLKKDKMIHSPNVVAFTKHFNHVSMLVASSILKNRDHKQRVCAVEFFIQLAGELLLLNNFNGALEVLSGLKQGAVFRLRETWQAISPKLIKLFETLQISLSQEKSYKVLRDKIRNAKPPCIPFLGMYLSDIVFLEDGNPDQIEGFINFEKYRRLAQVYLSIQLSQQTSYPFPPDEQMQLILRKTSPLTENQCYELSYQYWPRGGDSRASTVFSSS